MFKVNTIGIDQFRQSIANASKSIQRQVDGELKAAAMEYEALAKKSASEFGDRGTLRQSISYRKKNKLEYEVFVGTFYAPFIEFGTKSKARIPPGLEDVASQFKGLKGTGGISLIEAIKAWVKRKKIGATYKIATRRKVRQSQKEIDQIAFLIARSIYRNGISPQPFFYKHISTVRTNLFNRLNQVLSGI